ncbi:TPA: globin [Vibrio parahaemolyticus]
MNVIEVFNDSYERCVLSEHFFERFYAKFWSKGKSFRQKFEGVDMQKQVRMLKGSIVFFMMTDTSSDARKMMEKYGKKHGIGNIGIKPEDIDIWFESLLETVQECDYEYNSDVEKAWRACFKLGLEIMKRECGTPPSKSDTGQ